MDIGPKYIKRPSPVALGQFGSRRIGRYGRLLPPPKEGTLSAGMERAMRLKIEPVLMQQIPRSNLLLRWYGVSVSWPQFFPRDPHHPQWTGNQVGTAQAVKLIKWWCDTLRQFHPKIYCLSELRVSLGSNRTAKTVSGCRARPHLKIKSLISRGSSVRAKGSRATQRHSFPPIIEALRLSVRIEHKS